MKSCAMLDDILRQPDSLRRAWQHQLGPGADALSLAAESIASARRVLFTGMGSSLFAAIPAAYLLEQHGMAAECVDASELLYFRHAALNPQTTVVVVSRSGESVEVLKLLPLLSAAGAKVVGVSNLETSQLAREAPLSLLFRSGNDRMVSVQSYTSSVAVLLLLAARTLGQSLSIDGVCDRIAQATAASLGAAEDWVEFFSGSTGNYFLGRGAAFGSAQEAALLLHEAARTPAAAQSPAQFRHGPVEATSTGTRAVVFPCVGPARDLDVALAADLQQMGASVRICDGQAIADPFSPLLDIIPIQVASCAFALAQGLDPGDFRYASLVTASETGFRSMP